MSKRQCKYCFYCKCNGRVKKTANQYNGFPRKIYYCEYPNINDILYKTIGRYATNFIGYGDCSWDSPLQLKTTKRWCPLKAKEGKTNEEQMLL